MKAKAARVRRSLQDMVKTSSAKAVGVATAVAKHANAEKSLAVSVTSKNSVVTGNQFPWWFWFVLIAVLILSAWKLVDLIRALYARGRSLFCGGRARVVSAGTGQQVWVYTHREIDATALLKSWNAGAVIKFHTDPKCCNLSNPVQYCCAFEKVIGIGLENWCRNCTTVDNIADSRALGKSDRESVSMVGRRDLRALSFIGNVPGHAQFVGTCLNKPSRP